MKTKKEINEEIVSLFVRTIEIKDSVQEQKFEINNYKAKSIDLKFKKIVSLITEIKQVLN